MKVRKLATLALLCAGACSGHQAGACQYRDGVRGVRLSRAGLLIYLPVMIDCSIITGVFYRAFRLNTPESGKKTMENYFRMNMDKRDINAISNLGLAHIGDAVFEVLCRSYLCAGGGKNVGNLHRQTVAMVKATNQAELADKLLPHLTDEELSYYRRGKNSHVHAVPKGATPAQYAKATGLEALLGALYLAGETDRINELFHAMLET